MALNPIRLRKYRGDSRWPTPILQAVRQYRYESAEPPLDWLDKLDTYESGASGPYKGLTAEVSVWYDQDGRLGDDDVTGTFTDAEEPGVTIPNTRASHGDYKFYRPSHYRLTEGMDYPKGMRKADKPIYKKWLLEKEMSDDAERSWVGITVTLSLNGVELASGSLGGIDLGPDAEKAYLYECVMDCLGNAEYDVKTGLVPKINKLQAQLMALMDLRDRLTGTGEYSTPEEPA